MRKYLFNHKTLLFSNIIFIVLSSTLNVVLAFVLKNIIDTGTTQDIHQFYKVVWFTVGYFLIMIFVEYLTKVLKAHFIKKNMLDIKEDIFTSLLDKEILNFNKANSSNYVSILTNDMKIIEEDYFLSILSIIEHLFLFIIATTALFRINVMIALTVIIIGGIPLIIPHLFQRGIENYKKNFSDNLSNFTVKIQDIFSGFEVIKSFNIEKKIKNEYNKSNFAAEESKYKFTTFSNMVDSISFLFGNLMFLITLGLGSYLTLKNLMTVGTMIAAVQLMNYIVNPVVNVAHKWNKIKSMKLIYEKIQEITYDKVVKDEGLEKEFFNQYIEFKNVVFSYDNDRKVLDGVNIRFKKNGKYAIVGESGSGKSTILKLLTRYYNNYEGEIYIDGTELRRIKSESIYKLISIIQQNVFMFDGTIKDNIDLYQGYSSHDIDESINLSGLRPVINSLSQGENSNVGENGCNLSGGEKQRISIARAIIKRTPILILDEATSSLDNETSHNIEKSILNLKDLTSIVITHRLSGDLLSKYDGIFVVKGGKIIEEGNFEQLIEAKNYFYNMYNLDQRTIESTAETN